MRYRGDRPEIRESRTPQSDLHTERKRSVNYIEANTVQRTDDKPERRRLR